MWEYYFEPVMNISYAQLKQLLDEGKVSQELIHTYPAELILKWHHEDLERIATFWAGESLENPVQWMARKRQLGREYVSRYIKVKPHILAKVEQFYNDNLRFRDNIGVHIRGTDFNYAEPTKPEIYFQAIYQRAARTYQDDFKLFLATDQEQFIERFRQEFGERVVTYSSIRSNSAVPAFHFQDVSPYKKGEDVLIDILLLSRCDYLFKCAAAVGEYALWFNPELECTDFALASRRTSSNASAYLKLNVGQLPLIQVRSLLLYKKTRRTSLELIMMIGRFVLPRSLRDWLWQKIGRHIYVMF